MAIASDAGMSRSAPSAIVERQPNGEGAANARLAAHIDPAAVLFHDPGADVQAQPFPLDVPRTVPDAGERTEQPRLVFRADADPPVADRGDGVAGRTPHPDAHL